MKRFLLLLLMVSVFFQPIMAIESKPGLLVPALMTVGFGSLTTAGLIYQSFQGRRDQKNWQNEDGAQQSYTEAKSKLEINQKKIKERRDLCITGMTTVFGVATVISFCALLIRFEEQ